MDEHDPAAGMREPAGPASGGADTDRPAHTDTHASLPSPTDVGTGTAPAGGPTLTPPGLWARHGRTLVVAALLALAVGAGSAVGPTAWKILQQKNTSLDMPAELAGLTRDDSENARGAAEDLRTAISAGVSLDRTVGAVYAQAGTEAPSVLIIGGTGLRLSPEKDLDVLFTLVSDGDGGIEGVVAKPAGPLGGVLKCGSTRTDEYTIAVCGWADHGSLVLAMFPDRGVDESAELLLKMRSGIQHRG